MGLFKKKKNEVSIETAQKETVPAKREEPVQKEEPAKKAKRAPKPEYREYDAISDRRKAERRQTVRRTIAAIFFAFLFLSFLRPQYSHLRTAL